MDKVTELTRRLVEELDDQIASLEQQVAAGQSELHALRQKRAAVAGDQPPKGISQIGLNIVRLNNTLSKLKRTGASKAEILKAEKELADLRERLAEQKRGGLR